MHDRKSLDYQDVNIKGDSFESSEESEEHGRESVFHLRSSYIIMKRMLVEI